MAALTLGSSEKGIPRGVVRSLHSSLPKNLEFCTKTALLEAHSYLRDDKPPAPLFCLEAYLQRDPRRSCSFQDNVGPNTRGGDFVHTVRQQS